MQEIQGYALAQVSIICPDCGLAFANNLLVSIPAITPNDIIEADLHRVLPDANIRAAMIAVCPDCNYAAWTMSFSKCPIKPEFLQKAKEMDPTKKFALAIRSGRDKNMHSLDLGFLALNGLWCARELGQSDTLWLELAAHEHQKAIATDNIVDGYTHLVMGEIYRQLKSFDKAVAEYNLALKDNSILPDLINYQLRLAQAQNGSVTPLPIYLLSQLFAEDIITGFGTASLPDTVEDSNYESQNSAQDNELVSTPSTPSQNTVPIISPDSYYIEPQIASTSQNKEIVAVHETKPDYLDKFPEITIDGLDPPKDISDPDSSSAGPQMIIPDYTISIAQVENFLNGSRSTYQFPGFGSNFR